MISYPFSKIFWNPFIFDFAQFILEGDYSNFLKRVVKTNEKTLDIGCGTGEFCQLIGGKYAGIDINENYIRYASKKYGNEKRKFLLMDAKKMTFSKKEFNNSLIINTMHHCSKKDFITILKNSEKATKKEIIILDMVPPKYNIISKILYKLDQGKYIRTLDEQLKIIKEVLNIQSYFIFKSPRRLYTHSLIVCSPKN